MYTLHSAQRLIGHGWFVALSLKQIRSEIGEIERRVAIVQNGLPETGITRFIERSRYHQQFQRSRCVGFVELRRIASARAQAPSAINLLPSAKMRPGTENSINQISKETEQRMALMAVAVALGVGILIGIATRSRV